MGIMTVPKRLGVKTDHTGAYVVLRDRQGAIVEKVAHKPVYDSVPIKSWRALLRKMTNNGVEQFTILRELSLGTPFQAVLPDGTVSEPVIPTAETRRAASKDLLEFMHGKAVAQTEVTHAEAESRLMEQLEALSDEELMRRLQERLKERDGNKLTAGDTE